MSASLVGSEMCIRDSPSCRAFWGLSTEGPHVCQVHRGLRALWTRHFWGPVSYTHLTLPTICSV
eukprot:13952117-Alexandrium_andersonii.AAC.1